MTLQELRTLQPGDRVRIVSERLGANWNEEGRMDHWLGKIMTVRTAAAVCIRSVHMVEDQEEYGDGRGWAWFPHMIDCVIMEDPPDDDELSAFIGL